jgi:hypothetical protein
MSKTTLRNIIILFFFVGLSFIIYYLLFNSKEINIDNKEGREDPFGNFFPDSNITTNQEVVGDDVDSSFNKNISSLKQITNAPVAGYRIFEKLIGASTSTETVIQFVDRSTGHIFESKPNTQRNERISNTTIPKVYKAKFLNYDSNHLIYSLLSDSNKSVMQSYLAELIYDQELSISTTSTSSNSVFEKENSLQGTFLNENISHFTVSPENFIFALTTNTNEIGLTNSNGFILYPEDDREPELILNEEISQWTPEWINETNIALTTKPSYLIEGFVFILNTTKGSIDKIFGPALGLTSKLSPDLSKMFYSKTEGGILQSGIYNLNTSEEQNAGFATLAEKCVWTQDSITIYCAIPSNISGDFPDTWYLGMYSFNDSIVSYNTETRQGEVYFTSGEDNRFFDVLNPQLSENEDYLLFQNKKDLSLWLLDIK